MIILRKNKKKSSKSVQTNNKKQAVRNVLNYCRKINLMLKNPASFVVKIRQIANIKVR